MIQDGRTRLRLVLPAVSIFLFAFYEWLPGASTGLPTVLLLYAAVALLLYAWYEVAPRHLRRVLGTWRFSAPLAVAFHGAALVTLLVLLPVRLSTLSSWFVAGRALDAGLMPYRDFLFRYPPLAVPFFWLPAHLAHTLAAYRVGFAFEIVLCDLLCVGLELWAVHRFVPRASPWGILLAQPLWLLWAGRGVVLERFDMAANALLLLAIALLAARSHRWAWCVLGLGTVLKLYPALAVPFFALVTWEQRTRRQCALDVSAFALAVLAPTLIVVQGNLPVLSRFFSFQMGRGVEVETTFASVLMLGHVLTGSPLQHISGSGTEEVAAPLAPLLAGLSLPLTILALAALSLLAWRGRPVGQDASALFTWLVRLTLLALLLFIILRNVLSPQYVLWLYPLIVLLEQRQATVWALYSATLLLGNWIYPTNWGAVTRFLPHAIALLAVRNALLVVLVLVLLAQRPHRVLTWAGSRRPLHGARPDQTEQGQAVHGGAVVTDRVSRGPGD